MWWNISKESFLLKLVGEKPLLFEQIHSKYKDKAIIEKLWQDIAATMAAEFPDFELNAEECEAQWQRLRVSYGRHRKRSMRAGREPKWHHFKQIHAFLGSYFRNRNRNPCPQGMVKMFNDRGSVNEMASFDEYSEEIESKMPINAINHVEPQWLAGSSSAQMNGDSTVPSALHFEASACNGFPSTDFNGSDESVSSSSRMSAFDAPSVSANASRKKRKHDDFLDEQIVSALSATSKLVEFMEAERAKEQVDPIALAISQDLNTLPQDLRLQCIAEMYGTLAKYGAKAVERTRSQSK